MKWMRAIPKVRALPWIVNLCNKTHARLFCARFWQGNTDIMAGWDCLLSESISDRVAMSVFCEGKVLTCSHARCSDKLVKLFLLQGSVCLKP